MGTKLHNTVVLAASLLIALLVLIAVSNKKPRQSKLEYQVFPVADGWGYEILSGRNILIRQEWVPAIKKNVRFKTRKQAECVARFVMEKLSQGASPTVSVPEIKQICGLSVE
jgi:hypothetical protein